MLVLEGLTRGTKSTACAFSPVIGSRTTYLRSHPARKWSQHLGKLADRDCRNVAMSRAENAALKAFITRTTESYRPTFGRKEVVQPRQVLFIGTTNKAAYLRDETGGRRFWPVKVGRSIPRNLNAIAISCSPRPWPGSKPVKSGGPTVSSNVTTSDKEQEARFEADVWEAAVRTYVTGKSSVMVSEIALSALYFERTARVGTADQRRITKILERMGWTRLPKDWRGNVRGGRRDEAVILSNHHGSRTTTDHFLI